VNFSKHEAPIAKPNPKNNAYMIANKMRVDPEIILRDMISSDPVKTSNPWIPCVCALESSQFIIATDMLTGRIKTTELDAIAE